MTSLISRRSFVKGVAAAAAVSSVPIAAIPIEASAVRDSLVITPMSPALENDFTLINGILRTSRWQTPNYQVEIDVDGIVYLSNGHGEQHFSAADFQTGRAQSEIVAACGDDIAEAIQRELHLSWRR